MSRLITTPLGFPHHHHADLKQAIYNGSRTDAVLTSSRTLTAQAPLIISCPHAGRHFPDGFQDDITCSLHELDRRGDTFTEWLSMRAIDQGALQIISTIAPTFMNVGRNIKSIDPSFVSDWQTQSLPYDYSDTNAQKGQGLISTHSYFTGQRIYKEGRLPNAADIKKRITEWHRPYHATLTKAVNNTVDTIGAPLVFDVHSCPSSSAIGGEIEADIILSDADGRACDSELIKIAEKIAQKFNLKVAVNDPYKGGYITQLYGRHGKYGQIFSSQALQIEFNRKSYGLNEETLIIDKPDKLAHVQKFMTELSGALITHLSR